MVAQVFYYNGGLMILILIYPEDQKNGFLFHSYISLIVDKVYIL